VILVVAGAAALLAPMNAAIVERYYSTGVYLRLQPALTFVSNLSPVAIFDVLIVATVLIWISLAVLDRFWQRRAWTMVALRMIGRTVVLAAAVCLVFLAVWGLNYRRIPLAEKVPFDTKAITPAALVELTTEAVENVNMLYEAAHAALPRVESAPDAALESAFARVQESLGRPRQARAGRPKTSLLDPYFRAAAVDGMTAPGFAETLVVSDLLPVERPFVVAHEWSHLAGFADEAEASYVGWLTCLAGDSLTQYSGWLFVYSLSARELSPEDRKAIAVRLAPGPIEDLRAIADRRARGVKPAVSEAGWQVYDRYLKANRVERGAESYGDVLKLILGTRTRSAGAE
jgi:hypothetical protein